MLKKVNLGCGPVGKSDWINLDWGILAVLHRVPVIERILLKLNLFPAGYNVKWPENLRLRNCKDGLSFYDSSVDYIYTSHFLEHFKKFEAEGIIKECFRVLKNGGIVRIAVPDLQLLVKKYLERDVEYFKKIHGLMDFAKFDSGSAGGILLADILMDNFYPSFYRNKPKGIARLLNCFVRPHFWMYDFDSLKSLLVSVGFRRIEKLAFRKGKVPDLDVLDVFPEMTLYVEVEK